MSEAFTPGPWTTDDRVVPWRNGDWPGCMVRFWDGNTGIPIANCDLASKTESAAVANARLIAAAPELYEVLDMLIAELNSEDGMALSSTVMRGQAALAKVRGAQA